VLVRQLNLTKQANLPRRLTIYW